MLRTVLVVAIACLVAACGSPSRADRLVANIEQLSATVCACTDADCVAKAIEANRAWAKKEGIGLGEIADLKLTPAQEKTVERISVEMKACEKRVLETGPLSGAALVARLRADRKLICGCRDLRCVETGESARAAWEAQNADALKALTLTKEQEEEASSQRVQLRRCKEERAAEAGARVALTPAEVMDKLRELQALMCTCKQTDCAESMDRFRLQLLAEHGDTIKTAGLTGEADKLTAAMDACKAAIPGAP